MRVKLPSWLASAGRSGLVSAIAMDAVVGTAIGLTIPLLSFGLAELGADPLTIGLNTAMAAIASIVMAPLTPGVVARLGLRNTALAALLLGAVTLVGFLLIPSIAAWFGLRLLLGISLTMLFVISEFWVISAAPPERRGLVMGIYATVLSLGFAVGPTVLVATGTGGSAPYLAGIALFLVGMLPIMLVRSAGAPDLHGTNSMSILGVLRSAPSATLAGLVFGAVETGTMSFLPLYGLQLGFSEVNAATLLTAIGLGNVLVQIPLGLVSDRMDRRHLLLLLGGVGTLMAAIIPAITHSTVALYALLFAWGGLVAGMYTVGLAHLGGRFTGSALAQANAAFIVCYSLGMLVGPPLVGLGLELAPPHGAIAVMACMLAAYSAFVGWRVLSMRRKS
jgi:MFS family permease